jgi:hypothetical protein
MGGNNFSFERFHDLRTAPLSSLFADVAGIFRSEPENPVRYMQGTRSSTVIARRPKDDEAIHDFRNRNGLLRFARNDDP